MIKKIKNLFRKDKKVQYWSYKNGHMFATDEAIERTKDESLKTYNEFAKGNFDLEDVLSPELFKKVMSQKK